MFTDAAEYVRPRRDSDAAASPYQRPTYRYTPFLAVLLAHVPRLGRDGKQGGRFLFCWADAICGWMIVWFRRDHRAQLRRPRHDNTSQSSSGAATTIISKPSDDDYCEEEEEEEDYDDDDDDDNKHHHNNHRLSDALWWLYNPFAINICTRGSAESLLALLPVLVTLFWMRQCTMSSTTSTTTTTITIAAATTTTTAHSLVAAALAGISHGVAVHAKLYPLIYTLSLAASLALGQTNETMTTTTTTTSPSCSSVHPFRSPVALIRRWIPRLLGRPRPLLFVLCFVATFVGLTYLSVHWYGPLAWQEGLLYHLSRVDHRHNYSLHWYWIYLTRGAIASGAGTRSIMAWVGRILLLPQLVLLVYTSLGLAPVHLTLTLFVQTVLFVTFNKVITAQYFTWYLCLLPLCSDCFDWNHKTARLPLALGLWLTSIVTWLASAYGLEMQGMAVHRWVWLASLLFFLANIHLLRALLASTKLVTTTADSSATTTTNEGDNKTIRTASKEVTLSQTVGVVESVGHEKEE